MGSNEDLIKVLRNTMRMVRSRGFHGVDDRERQWINLLSQPDLPGTYIETRYSPHITDPNIGHRAATEPVVQAIVSLYLSPKSSKTLRLLMSDVFTREVDGQVQRCFVFFSPQIDETLKVSHMAEFLNLYQKREYALHSAVIVSVYPMFAVAAESFNSLNPSFRLSHFTDEEISFDPTAHIYSSPMRILDRAEKERFLQNPGIKSLSSLPRVFANEPAVKYIGAVPDDVIEYEVESFIPETLLSSELFHRCVRRPTERKRKVR